MKPVVDGLRRIASVFLSPCFILMASIAVSGQPAGLAEENAAAEGTENATPDPSSLGGPVNETATATAAATGETLAELSAETYPDDLIRDAGEKVTKAEFASFMQEKGNAFQKSATGKSFMTLTRVEDLETTDAGVIVSTLGEYDAKTGKRNRNVYSHTVRFLVPRHEGGVINAGNLFFVTGMVETFTFMYSNGDGNVFALVRLMPSRLSVRPFPRQRKRNHRDDYDPPRIIILQPGAPHWHGGIIPGQTVTPGGPILRLPPAGPTAPGSTSTTTGIRTLTPGGIPTAGASSSTTTTNGGRVIGPTTRSTSTTTTVITLPNGQTLTTTETEEEKK